MAPSWLSRPQGAAYLRRTARPEASDVATESTGPELRERPQATLGGAYALGRELEGGGMSRVVVAEDTGSAGVWS
jgi:hypothetical protein